MAAFLSEGFGELGRKIARFRLRRALRRQADERIAALTALGQAAWDGKVDLAAHAALRDRLAGLEARAGDLTQTSGRIEKEKASLEARRVAALEGFATRRKAAQAKKAPVDAALREAKKLAAAPEKTPAHALEVERLTAETQRHAAEIAAIDAEQKAAIAPIDADIARLRTELQGAVQQTGAVQKDRKGTYCELGGALYDAKTRPPTLADAFERVASIDRDRVQSDRALGASMAESRALAGATMAKFWLVMLGVPLLLAAAGVGIHRYLNRSAPPAVSTAPSYVKQKNPGECDVQAPPDKGKGVAVSPNCVRREGVFADGLLESGKIIYPDGRVAEGTFVAGQQFGEGKLTWRDGRRYEGMFLEGRSWGQGKFVAADGTQYTGMFQPGVRLVGMGIRKSPDGSMLVGEFVDGKPSRNLILVKDGTAEKVEIGKDGAIVKKTPATEPPPK